MKKNHILLQKFKKGACYIFFHVFTKATPFLVFLLLLTFNVAQEDVHKKIEELEKKINLLSEEVGNLRETIQTQQKVIEKNSQKITRKVPVYEEIIKELEENSTDYSNSTFYYLKILNSHLQIGGYAELTFETEDDEDAEFTFSHFALRIRSTMNEWLSFHGEIAIDEDTDLELSYAHLNFSLHSSFNIKAGLILVPFGQYNSFYPPPGNELTSIPLMAEFLIPTIWAEPGVSIFGQFSDIGPLAFTYEFLISNGLGEGGFDFEKGNRDARQDFNVENNGDKQLSGRIGVLPQISLLPFAISLGVSGALGEFDDKGNNQYFGFGVDGNVKIGAFSLIGDHDYIEVLGEYAQFDIERDARIVQLFPGTSSFMTGYYLQLNYIFFPEAWREQAFFLGEESQFAFAFRYENLDLDTSNRGASLLDDQRIYTFGINFRPIYKSVFKIEYNRIRAFVNGEENWSNRLLASFSTYF